MDNTKIIFGLIALCFILASILFFISFEITDIAIDTIDKKCEERNVFTTTQWIIYCENASVYAYDLNPSDY